MPGRYNGGVIFVVECCGAEVDQPDLWVQENLPVTCGASSCSGAGWYIAVVGKGLIGIINQENILRFEISVDQIEVVKDCIMSVVRSRKHQAE